VNDLLATKEICFSRHNNFDSNFYFWFILIIMVEVDIEKGWGEILKPQFDMPYFDELTRFVKSEYQSQIIYPPDGFVFQAFNSCPWDQVKIVILGQDPYINPGQAHGLSFSVPDGVAKPPSLQNIFKEIRDEFSSPMPISGNLLRWAEQGVLLLNSVLTVRQGFSNSHQGKGWEIFTDEVIRLLSVEKSTLVFMLWGIPARKKAGLIDAQKHCILESSHPSPMSVRRGFSGNKHFILCNEYLIANGKNPIIW